MSTEIYDGGLTTLDPDEDEPFDMNWDEQHLAEGVTIASSSFEVSGKDDALTTHDASVLSGNRKTRIFLTGGTLGHKYTVTNRIVTNTTPPQTKDASFYVLIQRE